MEAAFLKGREARLYWTVVLKVQLPMRGIGICIYEKGFHDVWPYEIAKILLKINYQGGDIFWEFLINNVKTSK